MMKQMVMPVFAANAAYAGTNSHGNFLGSPRRRLSCCPFYLL